MRSWSGEERRGWTFGEHWRGCAGGRYREEKMNGVLEGRVWSVGGGGRGGEG